MQIYSFAAVVSNINLTKPCSFWTKNLSNANFNQNMQSEFTNCAPQSKNQYELVLMVTFINDAIILGKLQSKAINPQKSD